MESVFNGAWPARWDQSHRDGRTWPHAVLRNDAGRHGRRSDPRRTYGVFRPRDRVSRRVRPAQPQQEIHCAGPEIGRRQDRADASNRWRGRAPGRVSSRGDGEARRAVPRTAGRRVRALSMRGRLAGGRTVRWRMRGPRHQLHRAQRGAGNDRPRGRTAFGSLKPLGRLWRRRNVHGLRCRLRYHRGAAVRLGPGDRRGDDRWSEQPFGPCSTAKAM